MAPITRGLPNGEPSYPSAVIGGVICIRSIHNRKHTELQTTVKINFKFEQSCFNTQFANNVYHNGYIEFQ